MSSLIQVTVVSAAGKETVLQVDLNEKLYDLKVKYQEKQGIPPDQQRFVIAGVELYDDEKPLYEYGIENGSKIHLAFRLRGGY